MARTSNGCPCSLILTRRFRSAPDRGFTSKVPKRRICCEELRLSDMCGASGFEQFTIARATDKIRLAMEGLRERLLIQRLMDRQTFELPCIDVRAPVHQAARSQSTRVARHDQTREGAAIHRVLVRILRRNKRRSMHRRGLRCRDLGARCEEPSALRTTRKPYTGDPARRSLTTLPD